MADETLDTMLRRLEQRVVPDATFADELFDQLVAEAGLRGGRRSPFSDIRWRFALAPAATRRLAWLAILAALLVSLVGVLVTSRGGQRSPSALTPTTPAVRPAPSLHLGSRLLSIGSTVPTWTGTLLDGGSFSTASLRGRPAALLLWCSCIDGTELRLFVEAAHARDDVQFVLVSMDPDGTTRSLVHDLGIDMPVVLDSAFALLTAWQLEGFPALVLLRADGTVADIQIVTFGRQKLMALTDALAMNGAIPDPDTRTPLPTDALGREPLSGVLAVGTAAPELSGSRLAGGRISTRDFLGTPVVVQFWLPPRKDGSPQDDTPPPDALIHEVDQRGGAVRLLLVVETEGEQGDAQRYLDARGFDIAVLVDHTGELFAKWGLVFTQTSVLLDAEGRVVRMVGPEGLATPGLVLDGPTLGQPVNPSVEPSTR